MDCVRQLKRLQEQNVLAQREMEKRRSPLVHRFRPGGRDFQGISGSIIR
jgi:hypothetical protein